MHTFHKIFYAILRFFVVLWFSIRGSYSCRVVPQRSKSNLILTNHNTNWDFFYFGAGFKEHMYFVASEHIFRSGIVSSLIRFLVSPIPRKKGASSVGTIREIRRRLDAGSNVCMMAEGNRSFTGETGFISPATAKLARSCGAGLITFRIHGGYFVNPRWGKTVRKGKVWGETVGQYTHEELKTMTDAQVYEVLCRDLEVDAYRDQEEKRLEYRCKDPAENLETALFVCPDCGAFDTLSSRKDRLVCGNCGSEHIFGPDGYFSRPDGSAPAFSTVLDWSNYQKEKLFEFIQKAGPDDVIRTDDGAELFIVHAMEGKKSVAKGRLTLTKTSLSITDEAEGKCISFDPKEISGLAVILTNTILFTAGTDYYELRPGYKASALHYMISYYFINGKEYER